IATQNCQRIAGAIDTPSVVFHFDDWTGKQSEVQIALDSTSATTEDANGTALETVSLPEAIDTAKGTQPFALVVGQRAAALAVQDHIVAAVSSPARTKITVEPTAPAVALTKLAVGAPPAGSGCPG